MSDPASPPLPAGPVGVGIRTEQFNSALTKPLTPEEMWQQAVQSKRGFESSRSGHPDDALRHKPATIPGKPDALGDPKGVGPPVGKGFETFGSVQVIDKNGLRVGIGADHFDGSAGLDGHAEARVIRGLEKNGPAMVDNGKMVVVVEQAPCESCQQRLMAYAQKKGIKEIEVHVPERASMTKPGISVSPKTASRTSFQGGRPTTSLRKLPTIKVPPSSVPHMPPAAPTTSMRTAVIGTIANIGAGIALGLLQQAMKEHMLKSLENLPKPKQDRREAGAFFGDPNTAKAVRLIDLFNKRLGEFEKALGEHHDKVVALTTVEIALLSVSKLPDSKRLEYLDGLQEQLRIYGDQLNTVFDNLEAIRRLESRSIEAAEGAEQVANMVDNAFVADWMLKQGFSLEEIVDIYNNLKSFGSRVRSAFRDIASLYKKVGELIESQNELAYQVNQIYWHISLSGIAEELKKRGIE